MFKTEQMEEFKNISHVFNEQLAALQDSIAKMNALVQMNYGFEGFDIDALDSLVTVFTCNCAKQVIDISYHTSHEDLKDEEKVYLSMIPVSMEMYSAQQTDAPAVPVFLATVIQDNKCLAYGTIANIDELVQLLTAKYVFIKPVCEELYINYMMRCSQLFDQFFN